MAGYYREFIENVSKITKPLTELSKKDTPWQWTDKEQVSFELLIEKLIKYPILQFPDFNQPFILTTDASGYATGTVLSQEMNKEDKPIALASRTLNKAELIIVQWKKSC